MADALRQDVEFAADGVTLRGWLFTPGDRTRPYPAIIMAHGFSAVKEMGLADYAAVFAAAGLAVLVYDHRNLGASDGTPRYEIDPVAQLRDYRHAITFMTGRSEIDPDRIGLWGTSYSGGLVLMAAAQDRRVRCVVAQVPFISGYDTLMKPASAEVRAQFHATQEAERQSLAAGSPPRLVPVCTKDPDAPAQPRGYSTYDYFHGFGEAVTAIWGNRITVRSQGLRQEYEAMPWMARIAPTPLLMIIATDDSITPTDICRDAYAQALAPKQLVAIPGGHYAPYLDGFAASSEAARDWFATHLSAI